MDLQRFYTQYNHKVRQTAGMLVSLYRLPKSEVDDLTNAGYIGVSECLHKFDPSKSPDIYNYCARNMRRSMMAVVREFHGNKQTSNGSGIVFFLDELNVDIVHGKNVNLDDRIDLKRAFERSYVNNPRNTELFVQSIIDERNGTKAGLTKNVTRQAIFQSIKRVRAQIKKELTDARV